MSPEPLAKTRARLGLTQQEFADRIEISRQHLSKLENSAQPLTPKLARRIAELLSQSESLEGIRAIPVQSWAQAGIGSEFEEIPSSWEKRVATDCPDDNAFAVEIQGDSMESKFFQGDIAILMPTHQPRNGDLVVARLEREGVVFKIFTARERASKNICCFTSYNPAFQPIEVPAASVLWNYPVYQIIRQVWR